MRKFVFAGTFLSHYMRDMLEQFMKIPGYEYVFIATRPFSRAMLGWGLPDDNNLPYVVRAYESPKAMSMAESLMNEAYCVSGNGVPVKFLSRRLQQGSLTFMNSERFFKGPLWKDAARFLKYSIYSGGRSQARNPRSKFYLMCISAFAAWDYNTCGLFRNKAYRWGYFQKTKKYDDIDGLISRKKKASILWAGRYLPWKHPELAVKLAKNLRDMGLDFTLRIIGSGMMEKDLQELLSRSGLGERVHLNTGKGVGPDEIRAEMENAQIFIFTSGRGEGWGVVLNEAMNSGCAVVAGSSIGAVPYLVDDGRSGLIFRGTDIDDLTAKVAGLLRDPARMSALGRNAYDTVTGLWSVEEAAKRFLSLAETLNESGGPANLWDNGPGSIAPVI